MPKARFILIVILSICFVKAISAQTLYKDCASELIDVYKKERSMLKSIIKANRFCHIKYTYKATLYNQVSKKMKETTENGELFAARFSRQVRSDDYMMFIDSNDMFSIDKKKKIIIHGNTVKGVLDIDNVLFNNNILDDSSVKYYIVSKSSGSNKEIVYNIVGKNKEVCLFNVAIFHYNPAVNMFTKVVVEFNPTSSNPLLGYTLQVHERNSLSESKYNPSAKGNVLTKGGQLKDEFKGYKYRNMTKD